MRRITAKRQRLTTTTVQNSNQQLPEEIMHDILSRVPAQSLCQHCRFVSKNWYNLINDPDFVKLHHSRIHKHASSDGLVALCYTDPILVGDIFFDKEHFYNLVIDSHENGSDPNPTSFKALKIPFDFPTEFSAHPIKIVGSANGLMCLCLLPEQTIFYICNPITRELLQLPEAPGLGPYFEKYNLEYVLPTTSGFGFHAATNTYKVVRTWYFYHNDSDPEDNLQIGIEIYTLGSGIWRWIDQDISSMQSCKEVSQVFLNDAFHWQMQDLEILEPKLGVIDIGDEKYTTFGAPIHEFGICQSRILSSLRQCLCIINEFIDHCDIWIMKQYGVAHSWTKEHVVRKEIFGPLQQTMSVVDAYLPKKVSFDTLTTMKNGSVLLHGASFLLEALLVKLHLLN